MKIPDLSGIQAVRNPSRAPTKALLIVAFVFATGIVAGATIGWAPVSNNDNGTVLTQPDGPSATITGDFEAHNDSGSVNSNEIQWLTNKGNVSFESDGESHALIHSSEIEGQWTNISMIDAQTADLTIDPSDKASVTVGDEVTALKYQDQSGIGVDDGEVDFVYSATGPGTITLRNLPADQTITAYGGNGLGIDEFTTDSSGVGTISVDPTSEKSVELKSGEAAVTGVREHKTGSDFHNGVLSGVSVHGSSNSAFVAATEFESNTQSDSDVDPNGVSVISGSGDIDPVGPDGTGEPILTVTGSTTSDTWSATSEDELAVEYGQTESVTIPTEGVGEVNQLTFKNYTISSYSEPVTVRVWINGTDTGLHELEPVSYSGGATETHTITGLDVPVGSTAEVEVEVDSSTSSDVDFELTEFNEGQIVTESPPPTDLTVTATPLSGERTTVELGSFDDGETKISEIDLGSRGGELEWSSSTRGGSIDYEIQMQQVNYDGQGQYTSDTHNVTGGSEAFTSLNLNNATATVDWEYYDGSSWQVADSTTYSNSGTHTADIASVEADAWRTNVEFSPTGDSNDITARLNSEGVTYNTREPTIEDPSPPPGGETSDPEVELTANITDPDFATAQGDVVTVEIYLDGESVHTENITSNQTVSTTVTPELGGTHNWSMTATDQHGNSDSFADQEFSVPSELGVYYETEPDTLVDEENLTLSLQFFGLESGEIQTRQLDNGTVDLTGLPVGERFVVTIKANQSEKFVYRRVILNSIYESERIFVLRENATTDDVTFELQDPTGKFPPEDTELYVEKPIEIDGETNYYPIAGDAFGATGRFPVTLENDARYRLRVRSGDNERILGSFTPSGNTLEPLQIQRVEPSADAGNAGAVYGSLTEDSNSSAFAVRYRGGDPGTEVTYEVTDDDGTVVVPETSTVATDFAHVYDFDETGTQSYNVSYTVEYPDGETQTGHFIVGHLDGIADRFDIDPQILSIMSWVAILATMGLIVIVDRKLAPAAGTGMASALAIIGTVAIPMPVLGVAGAVSVLTLFGGRQ